MKSIEVEHLTKDNISTGYRNCGDGLCVKSLKVESTSQIKSVHGDDCLGKWDGNSG